MVGNWGERHLAIVQWSVKWISDLSPVIKPIITIDASQCLFYQSHQGSLGQPEHRHRNVSYRAKICKSKLRITGKGVTVRCLNHSVAKCKSLNYDSSSFRKIYILPKDSIEQMSWESYILLKRNRRQGTSSLHKAGR